MLRAKLVALRRRIARHLPEILATTQAIALYGETNTDLTSSIQSILPMIMAIMSIAIPLTVLKFLLRFLDDILKGFGK